MPAKPRKPKAPKPPAIETVEQLHSTVDTIAELEVELRERTAARDKALQVIVAEHDGPIEDLKKRIASLMKLAGTYTIAHRAKLFADRVKSAFSTLTRYGIRDGNPTLKLLNRKHTWESVLAACKGAGRTEFIRTTEEVDKDAIKAAVKAEKLTDAGLAVLGLRLDQGESFFVESKAEDAARLSAKSSDNEDDMAA